MGLGDQAVKRSLLSFPSEGSFSEIFQDTLL